MPNISYIHRKPEPLGTEFKCIVDGFSGIMLLMEIQEGKKRIKMKEFSNLGGTAACTTRAVRQQENSRIYQWTIFQLISQKDVIMATAGLALSRQYLILLKLVIMLS